MGYPIVNSIEGPLPEITSSNCTEGCITRCILNYNINDSINASIIVYVLRLNNSLYLIDSYTQMVIVYDSPNPNMLLMPRVTGSSSIIVDGGLFPNDV